MVADHPLLSSAGTDNEAQGEVTERTDSRFPLRHYSQQKRVYCYANYSSKSVETNAAKYDPSSPLLCGQVQEDDKITIRKVESLKETQLSIFDM